MDYDVIVVVYVNVVDDDVVVDDDAVVDFTDVVDDDLVLFFCYCQYNCSCNCFSM